MPAKPLIASPIHRLLAQQALSRAAGAPLMGGNAVELLIDAPVHYAVWLKAIRGAQHRVLLENYIIRDDEVGREFRDVLIERAQAGVLVAVITDWAGCLGQSRSAFWQPLRAAGGNVRVFNPPQLGEPFGWISRDHRKLLVIDGVQGFLSGVCISAKWLGNASRNVPPWRDTGVAIRGPAVTEIEAAFAQSWSGMGAALPEFSEPLELAEPAGSTDVRVIATQPASASMYRLDQLIAAMAQQNALAHRCVLRRRGAVCAGPDLGRARWRGRAPAGARQQRYSGGRRHVARGLSPAAESWYPRIRVEWLDAARQDAVADGQWARVGSSNLNIASWLGNHEIDVAVEDEGFAGQLAVQYERDLENATEIVLVPRKRRHRSTEKVRSSETRPPRVRHAGGSSSRAAVGALRIANSMSAVLTNRRVLGDVSIGPMLIGTLALVALTIVAILWPASVAWPFALFACMVCAESRDSQLATAQAPAAHCTSH
jgi:cardiolipin synthase